MGSLNHYVLIDDCLEKIAELGGKTSVVAVSVLLKEAGEACNHLLRCPVLDYATYDEDDTFTFTEGVAVDHSIHWDGISWRLECIDRQ